MTVEPEGVTWGVWGGGGGAKSEGGGKGGGGRKSIKLPVEGE